MPSSTCAASGTGVRRCPVLRKYPTPNPKIFLRPTTALKSAQIKLLLLRQGYDVEVDNWEELAFLNEILQFVGETTRDKVSYVREAADGMPGATYTVQEIHTCICQDVECRPQSPVHLDVPALPT